MIDQFGFEKLGDFFATRRIVKLVLFANLVAWRLLADTIVQTTAIKFSWTAGTEQYSPNELLEAAIAADEDQ